MKLPTVHISLVIICVSQDDTRKGKGGRKSTERRAGMEINEKHMVVGNPNPRATLGQATRYRLAPTIPTQNTHALILFAASIALAGRASQCARHRATLRLARARAPIQRALRIPVRREGTPSVTCLRTRTDTGVAATTARTEACEGGLGEYVVHRHVRYHGPVCGAPVLQARHYVSLSSYIRRFRTLMALY